MDTQAQLNADDILSIPLDHPRRLFSATRTQAREQYCDLACQWHPDRNPAPVAEKVFAHINALYQASKAGTANGARPGRGSALVRARGGRTFRIRYRARHGGDLGDTLIANDVIAYLLRPDERDLFQRGESAMQALSFANDGMRAQMSPLLPRPRRSFTDEDGGGVTVLAKRPGEVPLADVLAHLGGRLDPRQAAWIVSGCLNLACYLQWAGWSHGAMTADNLFISPAEHSVALLGGWWYAARFGERLQALPRAVHDIAPPDALARKLGDPRFDLEAIRALGRELLGDRSGLRLAHDPDTPTALADWLTLPSSGDARRDYENWQWALIAAFGPKRFVPWPLTADDIYGQPSTPA